MIREKYIHVCVFSLDDLPWGLFVGLTNTDLITHETKI